MPLMPTGQLRIMAENLLTTGVNAITSTPINPIYPIANLTSDFRGRPVKFVGRFTIGPTNKNLYINDGANKTIVLAEGEYNRTTLVAEIQSKLNASSSGFTVLWSAVDNNFIIQKSGVWILRLSVTTNAVHVTLGFTGSSNLTGQTTYSGDVKRFHYPNEFIKIDYGYFPEIGFLSLISDSRYLFSLTEMANVRIQANTIDDFTAPPLDRVLTVTEKGIFEFFDDDDYNYRYWKLVLEDNNGTEDITIGYMYLGELTTFIDRSNGNPTYHAQGSVSSFEDTSEKVYSEAGQAFILEKQLKQVHESVTLQMIDPSNKDYLNDIWKRFKTVRPFFISLDPKLELSNDIEDLTFFCNFTGKPAFAHASTNKYNTQFGVEEWL